MAKPDGISVVIASYNRGVLLKTLLQDLEAQSVARDDFDVIVVDDGSATPVSEALEGFSVQLNWRVLRQANGGPGAARHRGILESAGPIIVIIDDDMRVPPTFLEAHRELHRQGHTVVLGYIRPAPNLEEMPLFERFHAEQLDKWVDSYRNGAKARGVQLCTGNVSFRKDEYLKVGGFDAQLKRSEDRDLGVRLEFAGARIVFGENAWTTHGSDHKSLKVWLERAYHYGISDSQISVKHPEVVRLNPWRFWFLVNPISRPFLLGAVLVPQVVEPLPEHIMHMSDWLDAQGQEKWALRGTTLAYGIQYFRGIRKAAGSLPRALRGLVKYARERKYLDQTPPKR